MSCQKSISQRRRRAWSLPLTALTLLNHINPLLFITRGKERERQHERQQKVEPEKRRKGEEQKLMECEKMHERMIERDSE